MSSSDECGESTGESVGDMGEGGGEAPGVKVPGPPREFLLANSLVLLSISESNESLLHFFVVLVVFISNSESNGLNFISGAGITFLFPVFVAPSKSLL